MRSPKDINNYSDLCRQENGIIKVWCVECERWADVIVIASATVTYRQNKWTNITENAIDVHYHCGTHNCKADIEYLLCDSQKIKILELVEVPVPKKPTIIQPPRKILSQRQLRMEI